MTDLFKEVLRIDESIEARRDLDAQIRQGDQRAVMTFVLFAVWRQIKQDRTIPTKQKPRLFRTIANSIDLNVAFESNEYVMEGARG